MKSKDLTPIYLEAMDRIAREVEAYSCTAIRIQGDPSWEAVQLYTRIFSPDGKCGSHYGPFALAVNSGPDPKGHRLLMLALASVCWRDFLDV